MFTSVKWVISRWAKLPRGKTYEVVDRTKESIAKAFEGKTIDERWQCQLHHPLHAVGHYLNPVFFFQNPATENCQKITKMSCMLVLKNWFQALKYKIRSYQRYHCTQELNNNLAFLLQKALERKDLQVSEYNNIKIHNDLVYV